MRKAGKITKLARTFPGTYKDVNSIPVPIQQTWGFLASHPRLICDPQSPRKTLCPKQGVRCLRTAPEVELWPLHTGALSPPPMCTWTHTTHIVDEQKSTILRYSIHLSPFSAVNMNTHNKFIKNEKPV